MFPVPRLFRTGGIFRVLRIRKHITASYGYSKCCVSTGYLVPRCPSENGYEPFCACAETVRSFMEVVRGSHSGLSAHAQMFLPVANSHVPPQGEHRLDQGSGLNRNFFFVCMLGLNHKLLQNKANYLKTKTQAVPRTRRLVDIAAFVRLC